MKSKYCYCTSQCSYKIIKKSLCIQNNIFFQYMIKKPKLNTLVLLLLFEHPKLRFSKIIGNKLVCDITFQGLPF